MLDTYWIDQAKTINDDPEEDVSYNLTKDQAVNISRQIKALKEDNASYEDTAVKEKTRIQTWLENKVGINEHKIERLSEQLLAYYRINKDSNSNFKFDSPYAKISDRKTPAKWIWDNEDKVVSSLENSDQSEFIKVEKKVDKKALKKSMHVVDGKVINSDGEIIDGITVTPQGRSVTLKVTEDLS
ncbi:MAG TPA: hypothetical protein DEQ50_08135 [Lactobacillus sp.]|nr:hypothetical protein [Lactobacillus sp.]